jgi:hypothetical protein
LSGRSILAATFIIIRNDTMGIKTSVSSLSYATNHLQAAVNLGQNVNSLHRQILIRCTELSRDLQTLVATMQTGDANIATINAQITALS